MRLCATRSRCSLDRWAGGYWASSPRQSPAATAIANSYWVPRVAERLAIARMGRRGDGIADTPAGPAYVPFTLPGEVATTEPIAGQAERRQLVEVEQLSPDRVDPISPYFGSCGGCALQHWALTKQQGW